MNSAKGPVSMDRIADVLGSVREKGVRLWSKNGQLHYRAPKGALTQGEIERLRVSRDQIVALLEATTADADESRLQPRLRLDRAPVTFSQVAHWNMFQLAERRSIRAIASATRMQGRLSLNALRRSIAEIIRRHDALRTRIVVLDGVPTQEISESKAFQLQVDDLMALAEGSRELEVQRLIEEFILEPVDVDSGSLFGVRLLRLRGNEHVLIVAIEHMVADMFSMGILLRELFTAYTQASNERAFSLPPIPIQFADYAVWQRTAQKDLIEKRAAYWNEHLAGCPRLRFPEDSRCTDTHLGWGTAPVRIGRDLRAALCEWSRLRQTTLVMSVFTAYVGCMLRWCDAPESVFQYQSDCRVSPNIENTIGYFASALYLRIGLLEEDSFLDLMNRATKEYCNAYEQGDSSYLAAKVPSPEFIRNALFNWVPQESKIDLSGSDRAEHALTCSAIHFVHPMLKQLDLDHDPGILLHDTDDEVVGYTYFPLNRFSVGTMERFGRNLLRFIGALLRQPEGRVRDILLI